MLAQLVSHLEENKDCHSEYQNKSQPELKYVLNILGEKLRYYIYAVGKISNL